MWIPDLSPTGPDLSPTGPAVTRWDPTGSGLPDRRKETSKQTFFFPSLVQVASFPFKGNTSFLVVMPLPEKGNVSSVLPKLNISDLYRRLPQEKTMQVNLPKVKLQYRQDLQEALTSMGEEMQPDISPQFGGPPEGTVSA